MSGEGVRPGGEAVGERAGGCDWLSAAPHQQRAEGVGRRADPCFLHHVENLQAAPEEQERGSRRQRHVTQQRDRRHRCSYSVPLCASSGGMTRGEQRLCYFAAGDLSVWPLLRTPPVPHAAASLDEGRVRLVRGRGRRVAGLQPGEDLLGAFLLQGREVERALAL